MEPQPCIHIQSSSRSRRTMTVERFLGRVERMLLVARKRHAGNFRCGSGRGLPMCAPAARLLSRSRYAEHGSGGLRRHG